MTVLIIATLACWRFTSLLVCEDGPGEIFARLRGWLDPSWPIVGGLLDCFWCASVWVALPLGMLAYWPSPRLMAIGWLAVSAGAIVLDELIPKKGE